MPTFQVGGPPWRGLTRIGYLVLASLQIFPRVFALGTRGANGRKDGGTKGKDYQSCTVETSSSLFDYVDNLEPCPENYQANSHDVARSKNEEYARYVKPLQSGELFVKTRGKEIIFAAGYVSTYLVSSKISMFTSLIARCSRTFRTRRHYRHSSHLRISRTHLEGRPWKQHNKTPSQQDAQLRCPSGAHHAGRTQTL